MKKFTLRRLPRWLPPAIALASLILSITAVVISLNSIRRIVDEAITKPVEEEAKRNFPTVDAESLKRLERHLKTVSPPPPINPPPAEPTEGNATP